MKDALSKFSTIKMKFKFFKISKFKDPFEGPLAVGNFLGLPITDNRKWNTKIQRCLRLILGFSLLTPFIAGLHLMMTNFRQVNFITDVFPPCVNLGICILRHFRMIWTRKSFSELIGKLREETTESNLSITFQFLDLIF